jgi:1-acyl-sn-glycerol-3-phosphate acyltransferase
LRSHQKLILGLAPEGTRRRVARWKTGFYFIALGAGVPVVPATFDYPRRTIRLGAPLVPTGDLAADMDHLQAFFRCKVNAPRPPP